MLFLDLSSPCKGEEFGAVLKLNELAIKTFRNGDLVLREPLLICKKSSAMLFLDLSSPCKGEE